MRIITIILALAFIVLLVVIANFYGNMFKWEDFGGEENESPVSESVPTPKAEAASSEEETDADEQNDSASTADVSSAGEKGNAKASNNGGLAEGVYVRTAGGISKQCSLSAFASLGLKKTAGTDSYVIIGDNDPRLEASYKLTYDSTTKDCVFALDEGTTKYYYYCVIWFDPGINSRR